MIYMMSSHVSYVLFVMIRAAANSLFGSIQLLRQLSNMTLCPNKQQKAITYSHTHKLTKSHFLSMCAMAHMPHSLLSLMQCSLISEQ